MKEEFFKRFYKNMNKEEIIRVATEDKIRADRNARLLNKSIEKNRELLEEKDKEIERLHSIIKEVREYIENNSQYDDNVDNYWTTTNELLEILDKER